MFFKHSKFCDDAFQLREFQGITDIQNQNIWTHRGDTGL